MNAADLLTALDLPPGTRVGHRVPKKILVEYGAPTPADRRRINEGIEKLRWIATVKPTTVGVPAFRDGLREYLEIVVLSLSIRPSARGPRLAELVHRAVPYPVFLLATHRNDLLISLAHKRWSQSEGGATVLDGEIVTAPVPDEGDDRLGFKFLASLPLGRQPRTDLLALYQGWMDVVASLLIARVTGSFSRSESPGRGVARWESLKEYEKLTAEVDRLRAAARKEKQVARQVEMNLAIKRLEEQRSSALQRL